MMSEFLGALREGDSWDFWGNDSPKCPHCGEKYDISRNDHWSLYGDDESTHEATCESCGRDFIITTRCSYTFSTNDQDGLEEQK